MKHQEAPWRLHILDCAVTEKFLTLLAMEIKTIEAALRGQGLPIRKAKISRTHSNRVLNAFQHVSADKQGLKPCVV